MGLTLCNSFSENEVMAVTVPVLLCSLEISNKSIKSSFKVKNTDWWINNS